MYVLTLIKYFLLIFSVCVLPLRTLFLLKKKEYGLEEVYPLGLMFFFCVLIFLPLKLLSIFALCAWALYLWILFSRGLWRSETAGLVLAFIAAAPGIFIFYNSAGHLYDFSSSALWLTPDSVWHIGLSAAAKVYGPFTILDLRIDGLVIHYHTLAHNLWAKMSLWANEGIFESILAGSRPAGFFLSALIIYSFFLGQVKSKWLAALGAFNILYLSSFFAPIYRLSDPLFNVLPGHMLAMVTGEELALGIFVCGLAAIYRIALGERSLLSGVALCFSILLSVGAKAPYGVVLVEIICLYFALDVFRNLKISKYLLTSVLLAMVSFIAAYIMFFKGGEDSGMSLGFAAILAAVPHFSKELGYFEKALLIVPYVILFFGPVSLIGILYFKELIKEKQVNEKALSLAFVSAIAGAGPFLMLSHRGKSQLYFALAGLVALGVYSWLFLLKRVNRSWLTLILAVSLSVFTAVFVTSLLWDLKTPVYHPVNAIEEGCLWLRSNTVPTDLIGINTHIADGAPRFFYCSALGERQFAIEGYEYTGQDSETLARVGGLLEKNKYLFEHGKTESGEKRAKYLIFSKDSYGNETEIQKHYTKVFEKDSVIIFKDTAK